MSEALLAPKAPLIQGGSAILRIKNPAGLIRLAGVLVVLLAVGAAVLPFLKPSSGTTAVGALLLIAGIVEMLAGRLRRETRLLAVLAGVATTTAGVLLLVASAGDLLHSASTVALWLLVRSAILGINSRRAHGSVRMWLGISAGADLVLGIGLLTGLSIAALLLTLFGETPQLVASFSWVLALSFVATGTMLLQVAGCERRAT